MNKQYVIKYQDEQIIVVEKLAGIGIYDLVNVLGLKHQFLVLTPCPKAMREGLVAFAKTKESLQYFKKSGNRVRFTFVGLCIGKFDKSEFTINDTLSGREAVTKVKVLNTSRSNSVGYVTLVELTCGDNFIFCSQQFRRHLYGVGHPIIGKVSCTKKLKNHKNKLALSCVKIWCQSIDNNCTNMVDVQVPRFITYIIEKETEYFDKRKMSSSIYDNKQQTFLDYVFFVNKYCLIPKTSSETIVNVAYDLIKSSDHGDNHFKILDCGTGCGCLLLSLLLKSKDNNCINKIKSSIGIDVSEGALEVAKRNAENLLPELDVTFLNLSFEHITGLNYNSNFVICNPPYLTSTMAKKTLDYDMLKYQPEMSYLVPGTDDLLFYKQVATNILKGNSRIKHYAAIDYEKQKNMKRRKIQNRDTIKGCSNSIVTLVPLHLILEVPHYLVARCSKMLLEVGYAEIKVHKDKFGFDRCLSCMYLP